LYRICLLANPHIGAEGVWLGNFVGGFQVIAAVLEREKLPGTVRSHSFNRSGRCKKSGATFRAEPEARWHAVLDHFEDHVTISGRDQMRVVFVMAMMTMAMPVAMAMMISATEQPHAGDIDRESKDRNGYRFSEVDRNGREKATDSFIADQQRDHRQDDRAGEA